MLGATSAALTLGCGSSPTSPTDAPAATTATGTGGTTSGACAVTPNETIGPYPSLVDLFRSDIREGKSGTTLTLTLTVVNTSNSCSPLAGVNVEIWQCDATGNYSQYGSQAAQTVPSGDSDDGCERSRDVYDCLSRLVSGQGNAHSHRSDARWIVAEGDTDRVSRIGQRRGVQERCLRIPRLQSDGQHARHDLRRQHQLRVGNGVRKPYKRLHGDVHGWIGGVK